MFLDLSSSKIIHKMKRELDKSRVQKEINKLRKDINKHNRAYYDANAPTIPDHVFDNMLSRLAELELHYPEFQIENTPTKKIGGYVSDSFMQWKHERKMLSLDNTYSITELRKFILRAQSRLKDEDIRKEDISCELKFDGIAVSLQYENGEMKLGATRGDGLVGEIITNNLKVISTIPQNINVQKSEIARALLKTSFEVRGEVIMLKKDFKLLNQRRKEKGEKRFVNARNSTGGTLKLHDSNEVATRNLVMIAYSLSTKSSVLDQVTSHNDRLALLSKMGFWVSPGYHCCHNLDLVDAILKKWEKDRELFPYEVDGAVLKFDDIRAWDILGETSKSPRWAVAYKFLASTAQTVLKDVTFQVSRTGMVTPVGELYPTFLSGSTVSRASLYNFDEIARLNIHKNDIVIISKAGDIIPKILSARRDSSSENTVKIVPPSLCPDCNTALVSQEGQVGLICPNEYGCGSQIRSRILHFASRKSMDIKHLGASTVQTLYELGVRDVGDLYFLKKENLEGIDKFKDKSIENLLESIQKSKAKSFQNVLYGLGILHIGETVADKLARSFRTLDAIISASLSDITKIVDIGDTIAVSLTTYFKKEKTRELIRKLSKAGLKLEIDSVDTGINHLVSSKVFVFSGVMKSITRSEASNLVKSVGGLVQSSITKKTDFLVAGESVGNKYKQAKKNGIVILSEETFLRMLNQSH